MSLVAEVNQALKLKKKFIKKGGTHWKNRLIKNYGLTKGLVDVDGNPVENDFPDQADMCEIIRALLANSKYHQLY